MRRRWLNLILLCALLAGSFAVTASPTPTAAQAPEPPEKKEEAISEPVSAKAVEQEAKGAPQFDSGEVAFAKLHPDLQELVRSVSPSVAGEPTMQGGTGTNDPILIEIVALPSKASDPLLEEIRPFFVDGLVAPDGVPFGGEFPIQTLTGKILPSNILKVAAYTDVQTISPMTFERAEYDDYPPDEPREEPEFGPEDWAELRANAEALREGSLPWDQAKAFGDGREAPRPDDWFEVKPEGPHKAEAAWGRGYQGEGVAVSVIDDGVDMAHPDMIGSQKIYSSTFNSHYNGWPMAFDPFSMRAWYNEIAFGSTDVSGGLEGVTYFDTSTVPELFPCGTGLFCFDYTPLIGYGMFGTEHTYIIDDDMTKSGEVHVGTHHDGSLRDYVWGERVAVLVTDPNDAGVYDTVYVDLDNDYDFRDEKPVTKADVTDLENTYNNPISYRDMDGDGITDLSGGMLYFIADGAHWPPGFEMLFDPAINFFGLTPPEAGDLIIMHGPWDSGYSHGTQCASNVVGRGAVGAGLPDFSDANPTGATYGAAPEADLVPMNNGWYFTGYVNARDAYFLSAFGWDEVSQNGIDWFFGPGFDDTDPIMATSNSYGWSAVFNDGYDYDAQFITAIQDNFAPYLQFLFSTGNGGPGYGTVAPPSPPFGIGVGASTQYGSTGWDTITDTDQIMFNDVVAFSNSGPGARGGAGVDVLAGGAFAAGASELNYYSADIYGILDGNYAWTTWGGTSRSSPAALGNLALVYQAYKAKHGVWPTHDVAKAIFMSGATDIHADVLKQGAGSANADRSTLIAGGHGGFYMDGGSESWEPGDYRGEDYPAFGHIVYPGDVFTKEFTLVNDSPTDVEVELAAQEPVLIDVEEFDFTVTADMVAGESAYGPENRDNFYKAFNYFIPITATAGMDSDWYNIDVPADTDMMIVRQAYPFGEFDVDGDYGWDNRFYLMVYNWKDQNNDGDVWEDINGNGVVNFINGTEAPVHDVGVELDWDDPRTELDRWEYGRFGYNRPYGNANELIVHDPLGRMHDGLFIATRHLFNNKAADIDTHLSYRVEFYSFKDVDWLSTDVMTVTVPASGTTTFVGEVAVPADMPAGDYAAAFYLSDPGSVDLDAHTSVVPVVMNVAQMLEAADDDLVFGGQAAAAYDADRTYNNGMTRGYFDWGWREESGDWRFFYMDIDNRPTSLFQEDFEGSFPPAGWSVTETLGSCSWESSMTTGYPNMTGGSGEFADANSDWCPGGMDTEMWTPSIDLSGAVEPWLLFDTYFDSLGTSDDAYVYASTDGGGSWTEILHYDGVDVLGRHEAIDLSAYAGEPDVMFSFHYVAPGWDWYWQVDNVEVIDTGDTPFDPTAHVIVKDEWEGPAPANDIDTIALGPTASPLAPATFGVWNWNAYDLELYGPYTLDIVGASPDDRAGRSIWRFNTSSGGNEDWIAFPIQDGLHELMQHHILFEGDQHGTVFTKTVGLLTEDIHSFAFDTYRDDGDVGSVVLESTIDLDGLDVSAYVQQVDSEVWTDEPVDFVSNTTIEWAYQFEVKDGVSIEAFSSSADIGDIDLYLFYLGPDGTDFQERASSTTASADEHVYYANPEDGYWLVGINNWSGPAGTFNLILDVVSELDTETSPLTVTGVPAGAVAADTPVTLDIAYDFPMEVGKCYQGFVNLGPLGAPQLKEIPIEICRLQESAMIEKEVNHETAFPGNELDYTIDLFNLSDPDAHFEFTDPIPEHTEFITASIYALMPDEILFEEDFEGSWPPTDWQVVVNTGAGWNTNTYWGTGNLTPGADGVCASADADSYGGGLDTELWSPAIDLTGYEDATLTFDSNFQDYLGNSDAYVDISTDGGTSWTNLWSETDDEPAEGTTHILDISAYTGETIHVRWHFVTTGWDWYWQIDDVQIGIPAPQLEVSYDAAADAVVYTGTLPLSEMEPGMESFEHAGAFPTDWSSESLGSGTRTWIMLHESGWGGSGSPIRSGEYAAYVNYEAADLDEWLYTPEITVPEDDTELIFWATSDTTFPGATTTLYAIDANGTYTDTLWDLIADESWSSWDTREVVVDVSAYAGETVKFAWRYHGYDGQSFGLDDVSLPGMEDEWLPAATVYVTVGISDTTSADDYITNTATLEAYHDLPQGMEAEPEVSAQAVTHIGVADLMNSTKTASAEVVTGDLIEYEITVVNSGDAAVIVTLTDTIPAGTSFYNTDDMEFTYDATDDQMEWMGTLAPTEQKVLTYEVMVDEDPALWFTTITNTTTLAWDGNEMTLEATTDVVPAYQIHMPLIIK